MKPELDLTSQESITKHQHRLCTRLVFWNLGWRILSFDWTTDIDFAHFRVFESHVFGGFLLEIKRRLVKFLPFSPQGRSYTAIPKSLRNCQSLINIRNIAVENFFYNFYCCIPSIDGGACDRNKLSAIQDKPIYLYSQYKPVSQKDFGWVFKAIAK